MGSIEARARRRADGDPEAPEDATRGLNIGVRGAGPEFDDRPAELSRQTRVTIEHNG
jgi:hypothetical protein